MKIIVANWKEYKTTETEAVTLARGSDFAGMVICPPHQFLDVVGGVLQNAALGAQDYEADMYARGVRYVIIGHSDRRRAGDTNEMVAEKIARAVTDGLIPILCVGEIKEEHERGETEAVISKQLKIGLSKIPKLEIGNWKLEIIIAYEPVWAISTEAGAEPETASSAAARIAFLKEQLLQFSDGKLDVENGKFLYGGSVNSLNAQSFLKHKDIDGLLVGAASLHIKEIQKIWQWAYQTEKK